jgi:hypothetical protein
MGEVGAFADTCGFAETGSAERWLIWEWLAPTP